MLRSQDEARFPLVPTLRATLGVKGHRPTVGTWDNKDQVYCCAALNVVTGQLTTHLLEQPARSKVVISMLCCSPGEVVMANEVLDGTNMISQLLGKGQRLAHQT